MNIPAAGGGPVVLAAAGAKTLALTGGVWLKTMVNVGTGLVAVGALLACGGKKRGEPVVLDAGQPID